MKITRRDDDFSARPVSAICQELSSAENPYIPDQVFIHGYETRELMRERSFLDVVFLLLVGELPSSPQRALLNRLFVALANPGPRHAATRAAMNAGVAKTQTQHILPIALSILGGQELGAGEVMEAMKFVGAHAQEPVEAALARLREQADEGKAAPGFGLCYGSPDRYTQKLAQLLVAHPGAGPHLRWGQSLVDAGSPAIGWRLPGLAACGFADLGLTPKQGAGLFQLACAPGLLAHGLEMTDSPLTAMPFIDEEHYVIES